MSLTMESDVKQLIVIATAIFGVLIAGYLIQTERASSLQGKEFTTWMYENDLGEFIENFFLEGTQFTSSSFLLLPTTGYRRGPLSYLRYVRPPAIRPTPCHSLTQMEKYFWIKYT